MPTFEERGIEGRLLRQVPDKLVLLPMVELVESARQYAAEHHRALVRALFYQRAVRGMGGPEPWTLQGRLCGRLFERAVVLLQTIDAHHALIRDRRPDIGIDLECEFVRSVRSARRRAAAQAFFHRHPRLRFLRRLFLGRKAVLRWAV